jgi:hypothetical protein
MSNWPKYESHKIVRAAKIVGVERNHGGGKIVQAIWVQPVGAAPIEKFEPTVTEMAEQAEVGGWAILYPNGFKSISPAKAFEDGYTLVEPTAAELGAAVRRAGLVGP